MSISLIRRVQSEGSKERFDAILARFGFTGISPQTNTQKEAQRVPKIVRKEEDNCIPDERVKQVKNRFYTFIVKKKKINTKNIPAKLEKRGGPFTIDPGTGVKVPNPQLLNERIKNPVFKSRYPRRKNLK